MIRQWLKDMRKAAGLSTYEAARRIGIAQSTYSPIETGKRNASVDLAKKIATFYGFEWTRFFED